MEHLYNLKLGSAKVWVEQWTDKVSYTAGETAVVYCSLRWDQSGVSGLNIMWMIPKANNPDSFQKLKAVAVIASRADIQPSETNETFTTLRLRDITINDKQTLVCLAKYLISGRVKQIWGDGTVLQVSEHQHGTLK